MGTNNITITVRFTLITLSFFMFSALVLPYSAQAQNTQPSAINQFQAKVYTEGDASVVLDDIVVTDPDVGEQITATLTVNIPSTGTLTATSGNGENYTPGTGIWVITGTVVQVNAALAAVAFIPETNTDINTIINVMIADGGEDGAVPVPGLIGLSPTAVNDPPSATNTTQIKAYTEGDAGVAIDDIVVSDPDTGEQITATLTLAATLTGTLSAVSGNGESYTPGTGIWIITGGLVQVNAALAAVAFIPEENNDVNTTINVNIADGGENGAAAQTGTITLNVTAVNDGPLNSVPGAQTTPKNILLVFSPGNGNTVSVSDIDAGANSIKITLAATHGTLTLSGVAGLNFAGGAGDGTDDATMIFTGPASAVNTSLNGLAFTPEINYTGPAVVTITTNDQGNTGGGALEDTDTVSVTIFTASITSFSPSKGLAGTQVTITGTNFNGATAVFFGNTGAEKFSVISPTQINAKVWTGTTGRIRVVTPAGTVESASVFTVIPPEPQKIVRVDVPNGYEEWTAGSTQLITWWSVNVKTLKIEYSTDNGATFEPITENTDASPGEYEWIVPETPSIQCLFRITDTTNIGARDESNAVFTITTPPSIKLTSPNGGEKWAQGTPHVIRWDSEHIESVKLSYSANNGADWIDIATHANASSGSCEWTVPDTPSPECILKITDEANTQLYDECDEPFSVSVGELPAIQEMKIVNNFIPSGEEGHSRFLQTIYDTVFESAGSHRTIGEATGTDAVITMEFSHSLSIVGITAHLAQSGEDSEIEKLAMNSTADGTWELRYSRKNNTTFDDNASECYFEEFIPIYLNGTGEWPIKLDSIHPRIQLTELTVALADGQTLDFAGIPGLLPQDIPGFAQAFDVESSLWTDLRYNRFTAETPIDILAADSGGLKTGYQNGLLYYEIPYSVYSGDTENEYVVILGNDDYNAVFSSTGAGEAALVLEMGKTGSPPVDTFIYNKIPVYDKTVCMIVLSGTSEKNYLAVDLDGDGIYENISFPEGGSIRPPSDVVVSDNPNDNGNSLLITWSLSPDDALVSHYTIFRSRNPNYTDPVLIESMSSLEELFDKEKAATILIAKVPGGQSNYTDTCIQESGVTYYYWIQAVSESYSSEKVSNSFITSVDTVISELRVHDPYPNPFNPVTTIGFSIPDECFVQIAVYDILGREVTVLENRLLSAGYHAVTWNGSDTEGNILGSGVYLYKLTAGTYSDFGKMMFVR